MRLTARRRSSTLSTRGWRTSSNSRSGNCASSAVTSRAAVSPVESEMTCSSTGGKVLIAGTLAPPALDLGRRARDRGGCHGCDRGPVAQLGGPRPFPGDPRRAGGEARRELRRLRRRAGRDRARELAPVRDRHLRRLGVRQDDIDASDREPCEAQGLRGRRLLTIGFRTEWRRVYDTLVESPTGFVG